MSYWEQKQQIKKIQLQATMTDERQLEIRQLLHTTYSLKD